MNIQELNVTEMMEINGGGLLSNLLGGGTTGTGLQLGNVLGGFISLTNTSTSTNNADGSSTSYSMQSLSINLSNLLNLI